MDLTGRPVLIKSGPHAGAVGKVREVMYGVVVVDHNGTPTGHAQEELELLFTAPEAVNLKVVGTEVDESGEELPETLLEDRVKPFGMSVEDLADWTQAFNEESIGRIRGTGASQYGKDGYQKIEEKDIDNVLTDMQEEVIDFSNYCAAFYLRIQRMKSALRSMGEDDPLDEGPDYYQGAYV